LFKKNMYIHVFDSNGMWNKFIDNSNDKPYYSTPDLYEWL